MGHAPNMSVISAPNDPTSSLGASAPHARANASCSAESASSVAVAPAHVTSTCGHGIPAPHFGRDAPTAPRHLPAYARARTASRAPERERERA